MVRTTDTTDRNEVDHAVIGFWVESGHPHDRTFIIPIDDDKNAFDLGDLVADRIEAQSAKTLPADRSAGDREEIGTVYWDEDGKPTRLVREDDTIFFDAAGIVDRVVEN